MYRLNSSAGSVGVVFVQPVNSAQGAASAAPRGERAAGPRVPIVGAERRLLSDLSHRERARICDDCFRVHALYFSGIDRETFERQSFSHPSQRVILFRGADGGFAGYNAALILRLNHGGQEHAVYNGHVCVDPRYKYTPRAGIASIREALDYKLRHPTVPLGYAGLAANPAGYRVFTSTMPKVYPSRRRDLTPTTRALLLGAARARGLDVVDEERLLARAPGLLADPDRIRASQALLDDPDAQFYLQRNPHFRDVWMLFWVPLDLENLLGGLARLLGRHLRGSSGLSE